jgi:hypothetical protein
MLDKNGKPLVGGYVMLDQHGTPGVEALSYSDWNGTLNARRILLDSLGRAAAIVENDKTYDMYVYNRFNVLTWSALGVNCAGEGGGDPLRFTSSDGSVIITRTSNVVDLKVHQDEKIFGSVEADSVDSNGLIEFDTVGSGDITVVSSGSIRIGLGKLYHITVALEFNTNTATPEYHICRLVDSENTTHNFSLDGSRTTQLVELSWDAVSTSDIFRLYIQAPSEFSVTSAELYIHAVNPVVGGSAPQMQSDWDVTDVDSPAFIKNKPDLSVYARLADLAAVAFSGDYDDLAGKPDLSVFARSADLSSVAFSGSYNDLSNIPANLVQDPNYVHTDENFTAAEKTKLASVEAGAEVNVQADWTQSDSSADDYIKNKPGEATESASGLMSAADKTKLDGIESGAEANVQADWNQSNSSADDYIKNKPTNLVPVPTAEDTDKILTATGAGTYSWQNPPKGVVIVNKSDAASTVASQIAAAVADGKVVYCFVDIGTENLYMPLCQVSEDGNQYRFFGVVEAKTLYEQTITKTNNVWAWDAIAEKTIIDPVQSDWTEQDTSSLAYILHKPPTLPLVEGDDIEIDEYNGSLIISSTAVPAHTAADSTKILAVDSNGELHWVDPSGSTQVQSNWNETDTSDPSYIQNKPDLSIYAQSANLATVATTGDYDDLLNKPSIPAAVIIGTIEL